MGLLFLVKIGAYLVFKKAPIWCEPALFKVKIGAFFSGNKRLFGKKRRHFGVNRRYFTANRRLSSK